MALTEEFRRHAAQKFLDRGRGKLETLRVVKEIGVSETTLNEWVNRYDMRSSMRQTKKRPKDHSIEDKLKAVMEFDSLLESDRGEFLRKNGLTSECILAWKQAMQKGLESMSKKPSKEVSLERQKIKELEKELNQKNKIIAETTALLMLKKKADLIWGDGEEK
jgi:transposase